MSVDTLSEGSLLTIFNGGTVVKPIFQILETKTLPNNAEKLRAKLSDGRYASSYALVAAQMKHIFQNGKLDNFCLIRANTLTVHKTKEKKVLGLLDIEIVKAGSEVGRVLGSPTLLNQLGEITEVSAGSNTNEGGVAEKRNLSPASVQSGMAPPPAKRTPLAPTGNVNGGKKDNMIGGGSKSESAFFDGGMEDISQSAIFPIAALTPYQNKWTIKTRVTNKSDIRRWNNSRGEGHLCSIDLLDESGEIRATLFNEQCDKYYDLISIGKVYYISCCSLKAANRQFNHLNNEYELTFRDSTQIMPCSESDAQNSKIPTQQYDFVAIADLAKAEKDMMVDVIGICKSSTEPTTIHSQKTQKDIVKRDLILVDDSKAEITLTLFGSKAETFETSTECPNPVVSLKGAKVSDFSGISLTAVPSTLIQVNPDMPKAHKLKGWYECASADQSEVVSLTVKNSGGSGGQLDMGSNVKSVGEVRLDRLGLGEKPDFYSISAYILTIQKDKALYQGCSRTGPDGKPCNKKVQDQQNGMYRCEKCNVESDSYVWRLILSMCLADSSGHLWATCFQESAESILGLTAEELGRMSLDQDQETFTNVFQDANLKQFNFRLMSRADNYNGEERVRHTVRGVSNVDYAKQQERQIAELKLAGIQI